MEPPLVLFNKSNTEPKPIQPHSDQRFPKSALSHTVEMYWCTSRILLASMLKYITHPYWRQSTRALAYSRAVATARGKR